LFWRFKKNLTCHNVIILKFIITTEANKYEDMAPYPTTITAIATLFLSQVYVQGKANGFSHDNVASVEESSNRILEQARIVGGSRPSVDEYPWFARATLQGSRWGGCGG
jgi:hypothetical protein